MYTNIDWQVVSEISTAIAVVLALATFLWQLNENSRSRRYDVFLRLVDAYQNLVGRRRAAWRTIRNAIAANENSYKEIGDQASTLDYLLLRIEQPEPLYAIEHEQLEYEIQSVNLLNEICRIAKKDSTLRRLSDSLVVGDISYYQNRLDDLLRIREHESHIRLFSIPQYESLVKYSVKHSFQT